ncbi:hypothetical protein AB0L40_10200 [Patulibacter sp. NPDC049589]|uniref:hypothetical protein n=1 Tax=Patulibacter sp. NPDC049589 TaxID=3154731 RepID=UPI00343715B1
MPPAIPDQPGDLPDLNTALQTGVTVVLWALSIALLVQAVRIYRRDGSPLAVLLWFAIAVGSLIEPLYDIAYHLFWHVYDDGGGDAQWTLFTAFDLPQPVWVMPAYIVVFAGPVIFMYQGLAKAATMRQVFRFAGITAFTTWFFETLMINLHLYSYWGKQPTDLLDYPVYISFMEAGQITGFAILVALLSRRATKRIHLAAVFVLFPANFAFTTLGAGFPALIAINSSQDASMPLLWLAAFASVGLVTTGLWWTARLLIHDQEQEAARTAPAVAPAAAAPDPPPARAAEQPVGVPAD